MKIDSHTEIHRNSTLNYWYQPTGSARNISVLLNMFEPKFRRSLPACSLPSSWLENTNNQLTEKYLNFLCFLRSAGPPSVLNLSTVGVKKLLFFENWQNYLNFCRYSLPFQFLALPPIIHWEYLELIPLDLFKKRLFKKSPRDNLFGYNKQEWTTNWILCDTFAGSSKHRFVWILLLMLIIKKGGWFFSVFPFRITTSKLKEWTKLLILHNLKNER